MGISRNCWKAWLLAFPLAASNQVCDDTAPRSGIEVLIGNYANIASQVLSEAQSVAERILSPTGLRISWRRPRAGSSEMTIIHPGTVLAIQLLPPAMEARLRPSQGTFGLAFGSTADIFAGDWIGLRKMALCLTGAASLAICWRMRSFICCLAPGRMLKAGSCGHVGVPPSYCK